MNINSKICILGSKGLLGHAIEKQLLLMGYKNIICCDHSTVDLCNQKNTKEYFEKEKPEYVFFLAANAGGIQYKRKYPADMLCQNLQMITNVMESSYKTGCKKMINVCSALLYPEEAEIPYRESDVNYVNLGKVDTPYSLAKAAGMQLAKYYNFQYGTNFITVVPCNFFGEYAPFIGDKAGVVSALIKRICDAKANNINKVEVWGTGNACRELLNSIDVASACIFLMNNTLDKDLYNIGRGKEYTIREVAETIKMIVGYKGELFFDSTKPEGRPHMQLNVDALLSMGWKPSMDLTESILNAYEWYRKNY